MKLNLEDRGVFVLDLSVDECRNVDDDVQSKIEEALDEAQALVFGGDLETTYLVIRVTKAGA
jgi:hypothetical protein